MLCAYGMGPEGSSDPPKPFESTPVSHTVCRGRCLLNAQETTPVHYQLLNLDPPKGAFWRFFHIQKPPINTPTGGCWKGRGVLRKTFGLVFALGAGLRAAATGHFPVS